MYLVVYTVRSYYIYACIFKYLKKKKKEEYEKKFKLKIAVSVNGKRKGGVGKCS